MPILASSSREADTEAPAEIRSDSIPRLVDTVRLDRYVPSNDAYEARPVHSSLLPSLTQLANFRDEGKLALNFTPRASDLPLRVNIGDVTAAMSEKIGTYQVVARAEPERIEAIIFQLRRLGIDALAVCSPQPDARSQNGYAWICAANYDELGSITAASAQQRQTNIVTLDATLPQLPLAAAPVPANAASGPQSMTAKTS